MAENAKHAVPPQPYLKKWDEQIVKLHAEIKRLRVLNADMLALLRRFNCHSIGMTDFYREVTALICKAEGKP